MDEASPLAPIPPSMAAEVRHDGVVWVLERTLGRHGPRVVAAGGLASALVAGLWLGSAWAWGPLCLLAAIAVLVAAQHPYRVEVRITDRAITVTQWRWLGRRDFRLPLDRLEVAKVSPPRAEGGVGAAVLRAGETVVAVGQGEPTEHLRWLVDAVEEARRRKLERERVEGREYGFMKRAPPAVTALRRDDG